MRKEDVEAAVDQLKAEGKTPSVRNVLALTGGRTSDVAAHLRELTEGAQVYWRHAPQVLELKARQQAVDAELVTVESELATARRRLHEHPAVLRRVFQEVLLRRSSPADAEAHQAQKAQQELTVAKLEAQAELLKAERAALPEAIHEAEAQAQHLSRQQREARYREHCAQALEAFEVWIACNEAVARDYQEAGQEFPPLPYGQADKGYDETIRSHGGLEPLFDDEGVRRVRGMAVWSPQQYGGRVQDLRDRLRAYLGLEPDRGEPTAAGAAALEEHNRIAARDRLQPARIAHEAAARTYRP